MKKILFALTVLVVMLFTLNTASAQNGNSYVGRAIAAYNAQGCNNVGPLNGSSETLGACFVDGFITRVLLFRQVNCQQIDCNAIRFAPVGYVTFGCDGEIIEVSCTWP